MGVCPVMCQRKGCGKCRSWMLCSWQIVLHGLSPGTPSTLAGSVSLHWQPLCRKDAPASIRCNLPVWDLWVWGGVSTMRSDFFYHWKRLSCWKKLPPWSIFQPSVNFSPLRIILLFWQSLILLFFALLGWPVQEDLEVNPSVEGSCLSFIFLAAWRGCVSSASLALLSVILSDPFCWQREGRQWRETEVVIDEHFLYLPSPPCNNLLASLCSCFMAEKTEGEQS